MADAGAPLPPPPPPGASEPPDSAGDADIPFNPPTETVPRYDTIDNPTVAGRVDPGFRYGWPIEGARDPWGAASATDSYDDGRDAVPSPFEAMGFGNPGGSAGGAGPPPGPPVGPPAGQPGAAGGDAKPLPTLSRARSNRHNPVARVLALLVPLVLLMAGATLMLSSLGADDDSSESDDRSAPQLPNAPGEPSPQAEPGVIIDSPQDSPATAPAAQSPFAGRPPIDVIVGYLTAVAAEDFTVARQVVAGEVDEGAFKTLDAAGALEVSSRQIGPDLTSTRFVAVEYRTDDGSQTTAYNCSEWEVNQASGTLRRIGTTVQLSTSPGFVQGEPADVRDKCRAAELD